MTTGTLPLQSAFMLEDNLCYQILGGDLVRS